MTSSTARLLIVDPCDVYRYAIVATIREARNGLSVVAESNDRSEAPAAAGASSPDVILLCLKEAGEFPLISAIHEAAPTARVVVISFRDDGEAVVDAMRAGAAGFVSKHASKEEILDTLAQAAEGGVAVHPSLLASGLMWASNRLDDGEGDRDPASVLSTRERTIFEMLAEGLTPRSIAQHLFLSHRTVEGYLASGYRKLGVSSRIEAVQVLAKRREVS